MIYTPCNILDMNVTDNIFLGFIICLDVSYIRNIMIIKDGTLIQVLQISLLDKKTWCSIFLQMSLTFILETYLFCLVVILLIMVCPFI